MQKGISKPRKKLSKITTSHYVKFAIRSLLMLEVVGLYIFQRIKYGPFNGFTKETIGTPFAIGALIALTILFIDMVTRFFPSKLESMGCQRLYQKNYLPAGEEGNKVEKAWPEKTPWWRTFIAAAAWFALNGAIGLLYYLSMYLEGFPNIVDGGALIIVCTFYGISDFICILFFCPFQTWFLKSKCCVTCRIYNWDFPMMFTPFVFFMFTYEAATGFRAEPVGIILVSVALLLLAVWEIKYHVHPERFLERSNKSLTCANCQEKLCQHKKQLRSFQKRMRAKAKASESEE